MTMHRTLFPALVAHLQELVSAMAQAVRFIFVKIVPDVEKLRKLNLFLGGNGRIVCFHPPLGATADATAERAELLAQLSRMLDTNEQRTPRPGQGQHVVVPDGLQLWPSDDGSYSSWAETVWAHSSHGIVQVYTQLVKKRRRALTLASKNSDVARLICLPIPFYNATCPEPLREQAGV